MLFFSSVVCPKTEFGPAKNRIYDSMSWGALALARTAKEKWRQTGPEIGYRVQKPAVGVVCLAAVGRREKISFLISLLVRFFRMTVVLSFF